MSIYKPGGGHPAPHYSSPKTISVSTSNAGILIPFTDEDIYFKKAFLYGLEANTEDVKFGVVTGPINGVLGNIGPDGTWILAPDGERHNLKDYGALSANPPQTFTVTYWD